MRTEKKIAYVALEHLLLILERNSKGTYLVHAANSITNVVSPVQRMARIEAHEFLLDAGVEGLYRGVLKEDLVDLGFTRQKVAEWADVMNAVAERASLEKIPELETLTAEIELA